jgi:hypothetical protein
MRSAEVTAHTVDEMFTKCCASAGVPFSGMPLEIWQAEYTMFAETTGKVGQAMALTLAALELEGTE